MRGRRMAQSSRDELQLKQSQDLVVGGREGEIASAVDKEEQERLSDIIKGVHKHLRSELSTGSIKN